MRFVLELVAHTISLINVSCFVFHLKKRLVVKGLFIPKKMILIRPDLAMMDLYSTTKLMQRLVTINPLWRILTTLHWLLVDTLQIRIRLKYWIFLATRGLKLLNILIIISKFFIVLKLEAYFCDI